MLRVPYRTFGSIIFGSLILLMSCTYTLLLLEGNDFGLPPWANLILWVAGVGFLPMLLLRKQRIYIPRGGNFVIQHRVFGIPYRSWSEKTAHIAVVRTVQKSGGTGSGWTAQMVTGEGTYTVHGYYTKEDARWLEEELEDFLDLT